MTDRQLLADYAQHGSEEAFAELVSRHAGRVYSTCLRVLGDSHAAEDASQAVFAILARKARGLSASTVLSGWLYVVARRAALSLRKQRAARARREKEAAEMRGRESGGAHDSWDRVSPQLDAALAALPAAQREAVLLRHYYGRSESETAEELGWGRSRVSVTLSRALGRLRALLGRRGVSVSAAALAAMIAGPAVETAPAGLAAAISATVTGGAALSPAAAQAAAGAVSAMFWAKVKVLAVTVCAAGALAGGGTLAVHSIASRQLSPAELPANTWVRSPRGPEYDRMRRLRRMISGSPRARNADWLFQAGRGSYSASAQGVLLPGGRVFFLACGRAGTVPWVYSPMLAGAPRGEIGMGERPSGWRKLLSGGDPLPAPIRWASLCHDPVNDEVLLFGGNAAAPGGGPGTMVFDLLGETWQRLDFSSSPLFEPHRKCDALRRETRRLEGRLRSRWHLAETDAESAEDLGARATRIAIEVEALSAALPAEGVEESRRTEWARPELAATVEILGALGGKVNPEAVARAARAAEHLRSARDLLAVEPTPRANSPLVCDPAAKGIVLFGGDHLDYLMSDTWVYDCASRRWELRRSQTAPAPRGGHAMLYLPKSGRVVMIGGYTYGSGEAHRQPSHVLRDMEMWGYATAEDRWEQIGSWPLSVVPGKAEAPRSPSSTVLEAVAGPEDTILCGDWVIRAVADTALPAGTGVASGTISRRSGRADPAWWDDLSAPDAPKIERKLAGIPVNAWTKVTTPKARQSNRDHSTAALDVDRGQILYFGGGRSAYCGTDVHLYSIRANRWRASSWADHPVGFDGSTGHHAQRWSFEGRPFISSHVFGMYAYDPRARLMLLHNRGDSFALDPATGEWRRLEIDTPFIGGWVPKLCATPEGVIVWSSERKAGRVRPAGLWRFRDGSWRRLKTAGGKVPPTPGDDYGGMAYDPGQNRLLMFAGSRDAGFRGAWACSLADGRIAKIAVNNPSAGPRTPREAVCLPGSDLVLFPDVRKGGNLVLDLDAGAFRLLRVKDPPRVSPVSCGLLRDDRRGLIWLVSGERGWPIHVLRFDPETARLSETK